jgi:nucleoside-diphosphate-sugar epimerase
MRVAVVGGTEFIGRRTVEVLAGRGDRVLVVHRGRTEPDDLPACEHVHADRRDFVTVAGRVAAFGPDAVVDTCAQTGPEVDAVLPHLPDAHLVVLSSMDVYRIWELGLADDHTPLAVPFDEGAPPRAGRYPYRGRGMDLDDYDKLDVEPAYLARGGTVLRLGMVHGPYDPQRREECVLGRLRAGRTRIPVGPGRTLYTRLHVDDAAAAIVAALDRPAASAGEIFNVGEPATVSVRAWLELIMAEAGTAAELVTVPDRALPADLRLTRTHSQHFLADSRKAAAVLGWHARDPVASIAASVCWHLAHPPATPPDTTADDVALREVTGRP